MEENEASDEARLESLQTEIAQERALVKEANEALELAEANLQKWTALQKEKQIFDALCKRLESMREKLQSMQQLREKLEKFPKAQALVSTNAKKRVKANPLRRILRV
jgi:hypothetical protein